MLRPMHLAAWSLSLVLTVATVTALPAPALAVDCRAEIAAAQRLLQTVDAEAEQAKPATRTRVQNFLDEARALLADASAACDKAKTQVDQTTAVTKVLLAQAHIAGARLFLKIE